MHLYLLRHGKAEEWRPGISDPERVLTPEGILEMQAEARGIAGLQTRIERIFTSPYPRALQTARIVAEALGIHGEAFRVQNEMAAGGFRMSLLQSLTSGASANARLLFVGHEPDLSSVAGQLVGGAQIELKKGGLIYIECARPQPGGGVLRWLIAPRHLTESAGE